MWEDLGAGKARQGIGWHRVLGLEYRASGIGFRVQARMSTASHRSFSDEPLLYLVVTAQVWPCCKITLCISSSAAYTWTTKSVFSQDIRLKPKYTET